MTRPDLCLDFANTRYWRGQAAPTETLNAPADLAAWAKAPKAPPPKEFEQALGAARGASTGCSTPRRRARPPAPRDLETLECGAGAGARTHHPEARPRRLRVGRRYADRARRSRCWRRCCGRPAICWPARGSTGCGAAPTPNAAGCSSTTAAPASAAGARCRPAATAPRPGGIITRARTTTTDRRLTMNALARAFAGLVGLFLVMAALLFGVALDLRLVAGVAVPRRLFRRLARADALSGYAAIRRCSSGACAAARWAEKRAGAEDHHVLRLAGLHRPAVMPALDRRFGWSHMPAVVAIAGDALMAARLARDLSRVPREQLHLGDASSWRPTRR